MSEETQVAQIDEEVDGQILDLQHKVAKIDRWIDARKGEMLTGLATKHRLEKIKARHEFLTQIAMLKGEAPPDYPRELASKIPQAERIDRLEKQVHEIKQMIVELTKKRGPGRPRKVDTIN